MSDAIYIQDGLAIDYTPGSAVTGGDVIVQGDLIGVAKLDIAANELGALHIAGVFDFTKNAGAALTVGQKVYWDDTNNYLATDNEQGTHKYLGVVVEAAASAAVLGRVRMGHAINDVNEQIVIIPVEDLAANADIATREIFVHPRAVTIVSIGILTDGAPAGVDDSNTSVIAFADDAANAILSKTYNTATQPPTSDYEDLGTVDATHSVLAAGEHVTMSITNGTTADLPAFSVIIRFIPANV
ncbi:MAG: DUF2190 family protein [Sedimentisphaerales bacterium]|nr:DUF2190 family protein [Sedimentisphaerales bacterium]